MTRTIPGCPRPGRPADRGGRAAGNSRTKSPPLARSVQPEPVLAQGPHAAVAPAAPALGRCRYRTGSRGRAWPGQGPSTSGAAAVPSGRHEVHRGIDAELARAASRPSASSSRWTTSSTEPSGWCRQRTPATPSARPRSGPPPRRWPRPWPPPPAAATFRRRRGGRLTAAAGGATAGLLRDLTAGRRPVSSAGFERVELGLGCSWTYLHGESTVREARVPPSRAGER